MSGALVHHTDILATLADIWHRSPLLPDGSGEDSFSFYPLLRGLGSSVKPPRPHSVSCSMRNMPTIRVGPWKLILGRGSGGWTRAHDGHLPFQLYNLESDPVEAVDVAANHSERASSMRALLLEIASRGRSTPLQHPSQRPRDEQNKMVLQGILQPVEPTIRHPVACRRPGQCVAWAKGVIGSK